MLHLRKSALSHVFSSAPTSTSPLFHLPRLRFLSAAAQSHPAPPFAVEDHLQDYSREASTKLSSLNSPSKPDAVVAFLRGLGLSDADIAAVAAKDPAFLRASVERTLAPRAAELAQLGLTRPEIARFVPVALERFRRRHLRRRLEFLLPMFGGSFDKLLGGLKSNTWLLNLNVERVIKPNVELLRGFGIDACDLARSSSYALRLLATSPARIRATVERAEGLGVPRGSLMFRQALNAVAFKSDEAIAAKVECLKKAFGWSDDEVSAALCRAPSLLMRSNDMLQTKSEFLISEAGLEPAYIARRPLMATYSLEGRLRPRYYVLKFLRTNGLLNRDFYAAVLCTEKVFAEKFIHPFTEAAPFLAEDYAAACRGEVPNRLRLA